MKVAYNENKNTIDIDVADKENQYFCIHCECEMVTAALESVKVSPYFRAKTTHEVECPVKNILTDKRYNNRESEIEDVYERIMKLENTQIENRVLSSNPDREKRESKFSKVKYLSQLVAFCLSNDIDEYLGDKQIKSFFVDDRTIDLHQDFKQSNLYLFGLRFKKYINGFQTIIATYPTRFQHDEIKIYFYDKDVYYKIKNKVFDKDNNDNYKDIYVLGFLNHKNNIRVDNENQFYFIPKNKFSNIVNNNEETI